MYDGRFGKKLHSFDLKGLMEKSLVGKRVAELFLSEESARLMKDNYSAKTIVFTQPLSEDGYISEEEKINIFKTICEWFSDSEVILKVHPRDTTCYESINANVITESYPSELLNILGVTFENAVGICTSAVNNINAQHCVNINDNFLKDRFFSYEEMQKTFIEKGMKKN